MQNLELHPTPRGGKFYFMKINDLKNASDFFQYEPFTGEIIWLKNGNIAGHVNDRGYRVIEFKGKRYKAHRIAWVLFYGRSPEGQIDHINQNKDDNRIENLRDVDDQTNSMNRPMQENNKSGYTGVFYHKRDKRWVAKIKKGSKWLWLGSFKDKQKAINARIKAEEEMGFTKNHGKH